MRRPFLEDGKIINKREVLKMKNFLNSVSAIAPTEVRAAYSMHLQISNRLFHLFAYAEAEGDCFIDQLKCVHNNNDVPQDIRFCEHVVEIIKES